MGNIAVTSTELTYRAKLSTGKAKRIIGKDDFGSTIPILVLDIVDESLDVNGG